MLTGTTVLLVASSSFELGDVVPFDVASLSKRRKYSVGSSLKLNFRAVIPSSNAAGMFISSCLILLIFKRRESFLNSIGHKIILLFRGRCGAPRKNRHGRRRSCRHGRL